VVTHVHAKQGVLVAHGQVLDGLAVQTGQAAQQRPHVRGLVTVAAPDVEADANERVFLGGLVEQRQLGLEHFVALFVGAGDLDGDRLVALVALVVTIVVAREVGGRELAGPHLPEVLVRRAGQLGRGRGGLLSTTTTAALLLVAGAGLGLPGLAVVLAVVFADQRVDRRLGLAGFGGARIGVGV